MLFSEVPVSLSSQRRLGPSVVKSVNTTLGPDFRQDDSPRLAV